MTVYRAIYLRCDRCGVLTEVECFLDANALRKRTGFRRDRLNRRDLCPECYSIGGGVTEDDRQ